MKKIREIDFFFQSFSQLNLDNKTPILCFVIEGQHDSALKKVFPEVSATAERFDSMYIRGDKTLSIFNVTRGDFTTPVGIIYIRKSWWRKRHNQEMDIGSINFYRELLERTTYGVQLLRRLNHKNAIFVLPERFTPRNISNDRKQQYQLHQFIRAVTEGIIVANSLDFGPTRLSPSLKSATLVHFGKSNRVVDNFFQRSIDEGRSIGEAVTYVRHLTMLPPNLKHPLAFIQEAVGGLPRKLHRTSNKSHWRIIKNHSFSSRTTVSCCSGIEALEHFGFGLLVAVGKGGSHEPALLKVHYRPDTKRQKPIRKIVIVGKGITFDTGGIDLKLTGAYDRMHYDMAGAATALAMIKLAEQSNLAVEIIILAPIAQNAIGPNATTPHDIITSFNGKTVEVINTDAEGRLILADAIDYSERHLNPDLTITIATLSAGSDFGPDFIQVGIGNKTLQGKINGPELKSTEKLFVMPLLDRLDEVDNAHVGNISDLVNDPTPEYFHTSAFVFLSNFFRYAEPEFLYIDIGSIMEVDADDYSAGPGFGTKFLWYFLKQFS